MKTFTQLFFLVLLIGLSSCYKTSSEPTVIYTVDYEVSISGDVFLDTVQYKDMSGAIVTKLNVSSDFHHSYTSENAYDASLFVAGNIIDGTVESNLSILTGTTVNFEDPLSETWEGSADSLYYTYNSARKLTLSK